MRGRSSLSATTVLIAGVPAEVSFAGAQGDLIGLDQLNLTLPRSLAGRGELCVVLVVDGKSSNIVALHFK